MAALEALSDEDASALAASRLPEWTVAEGWLVRSYRVHGWKSAVLLTGLVAHLAESAWHHPEIVLAFGSVTVRLRTHSAKAITELDFALAEKIEELAFWPAGDDPVLPGTPSDARHAYVKRN